MDISGLLEEYSLTDFAVGLGGCQNSGPMQCCEYDIAVFDEKSEADTILNYDGGIARIHHNSFNEARSNILVHLCDLKIVSDKKMHLGTFLSKINERRSEIFADAAKNCLLDSMFCNARALDAETESALTLAWAKCAALYMADAICLANMVRPSPAHMLGAIRRLETSKINEKLGLVTSCMGMERTSPVLLRRMASSTAGLSDGIEGNDHSKIIRLKCDYMISASLLPDCYFYLCCINKEIMAASKDFIARDEKTTYILNVAFDLDTDDDVAVQCSLLQAAARDILALL